MKTSYKNYIQSLRAFSVLIVFFYHLNLDIFSKGYLGVDIFFVISGYVISQRIYKDYILNNKILIKDFFIRRLKRIFPVLIFVILTTLIIYIIFGPVDFLKKNFDTSFFSILGVSNIYFLLRKKDYFDTVFDDPLGHTWSLGVEEQFYIIYPLLLYLFFTYIKFEKEKKIIFIFLNVLIILIIITFYFSKINPLLVFYFPIFRFWEFLAGCVLFFISVKFNVNRNNLISSFCFIIVLVILFFDLPQNYISYVLINLLVVIFSSLLIFFYNENIFNKIVFENKIAIFIGNISYSLYLWHLPVIYFTELYYGNYIKSLISLPISILLSIFTYHFIEKKFRYYNFKINTRLFYKVTIFLVFSTLFFIFYIVSQKSYNSYTKLFIKNSVKKINYLEQKLNYSERTNFYKIKINDYEIYRFCTQNSKEYKLNRFNLRSECIKNNNQKILFYSEGNSQMAQFVPLLYNSNLIENIYYEHKKGPINEIISFQKINNLLMNFKKIVYVININSIEEFIYLKKNLDKFKDSINILVIGPIPHVNKDIDPLKCFIRQVSCTFNTQYDIENRKLNDFYKEVNKLTAISERIIFYNPYKVICPEKICYAYNQQKKILTYRDKNHITQEASKLLDNDFNIFLKKNLN